jgi:hypothetical protein
MSQRQNARESPSNRCCGQVIFGLGSSSSTGKRLTRISTRFEIERVEVLGTMRPIVRPVPDSDPKDR